MADDVYTKMAWEFTGVPCDLTCEGSEFCTHDLAKFAREVAARTMEEAALMASAALVSGEDMFVTMRRRAEEIRRG